MFQEVARLEGHERCISRLIRENLETFEDLLTQSLTFVRRGVELFVRFCQLSDEEGGSMVLGSMA